MTWIQLVSIRALTYILDKLMILISDPILYDVGIFDVRNRYGLQDAQGPYVLLCC